MSIKIGLIHTTVNSIQPINEAFNEHAPDVKVLNFLDEGLMEEINNSPAITPSMVRKLTHMMDRAENSGVNGILLACTVFSPYVKDIEKLFAVPVLSADISMLEHAIQLGNKIGVIATVATAGPTTEGLLKEIAQQTNKKVDVYTHIITEAFSALKSGNAAKHNELIQNKIHELTEYCDAVILAQMSMTRAVKGLDKISKPVLTSPEISVKAMLARIN
ncbi:aspartate/glutamate racemase family protein [Sporomusa acidovorans]|uniref:Asp/Glu/hydantoin racemase n=1 Tax=Sporomusa acidovorans (strain ATCC 49682 / DSM 3132 / Mol) TaxID=1123286 RepID=A0ABZ3J1G0_SPOA4|nr:aspartate/glutamate racemase family protein [Sporomusa acidovorans]OZC16542.1 glutamate racemase [Sporomusa acidovorans DSM 3132]SDF61088.1 Aspartate/glutamate racemase [Sporomusa acidovorans]